MTDKLEEDCDFLRSTGWKRQPTPDDITKVSRTWWLDCYTPTRCYTNPDKPMMLRLIQSCGEPANVNASISYRLILRAHLSDDYQVTFEVTDHEYPGKLQKFLEAYVEFLCATWEKIVAAYHIALPGGSRK